MSDDNWADAMFSTDAAQGHHQGQVKMRAARISGYWLDRDGRRLDSWIGYVDVAMTNGAICDEERGNVPLVVTLDGTLEGWQDGSRFAPAPSIDLTALLAG